MIFKKDIYYFRLLEDRIELKNLRTGKSIERIPTYKYSNKRLLIANFKNAELEMKKAIKALKEESFFLKNTVFVFQPIHKSIKEYSSVETRAFKDSCAHAGAKEVYLYLKQDLLSDKTVLSNIHRKTTIFEF